jgi:hypothetical protein
MLGADIFTVGSTALVGSNTDNTADADVFQPLQPYDIVQLARTVPPTLTTESPILTTPRVLMYATTVEESIHTQLVDAAEGNVNKRLHANEDDESPALSVTESNDSTKVNPSFEMRAL